MANKKQIHLKSKKEIVRKIRSMKKEKKINYDESILKLNDRLEVLNILYRYIKGKEKWRNLG